jgi:hypothetical protein
VFGAVGAVASTPLLTLSQARRRRLRRFDTSAHGEHVQGAAGADTQAPLLTLSTCSAP